MKPKIIIYMVVRNISVKEKLFSQVVFQASKISKDFFIVNHGSDDNTIEIIKDLKTKNNLNLELKNEVFELTMDDMKGKYYKELLERYGKEKVYIFILDWDEVLDEKLVEEINNLNFKNDVYLINRQTYLVKNVIDRNAFLPLLFEINSVEIAPFKVLHKLYNVKSKNTKKTKGILHHYSYSSTDDLVIKTIYYSKIEAEALYKQRPNIGNFMIFLKFNFEGTIYFLYTLFYHLNFLHLEGWFYSLNWYVYKFYKYLFYYELKTGGKKIS